MEYTHNAYMMGSMPLHTLEPYQSKPIPGYELKSKKHATIDLDSFLHNKKYPVPEASPKFGNPDLAGRHRQAVSQGAKVRCPRSNPCPTQPPNPKDRSSFDAMSHYVSKPGKENPPSSFMKPQNYGVVHKKDVSNSMLVEKSAEVMKEVRDCMNKSYDYKKTAQGRSHSHTQKLAYGYDSKVPEPVTIKQPQNCINTKEIEIGLGNHKKYAAVNPQPHSAWNDLGFTKPRDDKSDNQNCANRIEAELKKIRREPPGHGGRGRVHALFEEIIASVPYYGKALRVIKEMYESKISQLNERVGRHDIKCKEYKELAEREKLRREEGERKYEVLKNEMKKQLLYMESQKEIIKDLKGRLESGTTIIKESHNSTLPVGYLKPRENSRERGKLDRVIVPPLDLSRIKRERGSNKPKTDPNAAAAAIEFQANETKDMTALLDELSQ